MYNICVGYNDPYFNGSGRGNGWDYEMGMSRNAADAYEEGKQPKSKWSKQAMVLRIKELLSEEGITPKFTLSTVAKLTKEQLFETFMRNYGWHHTSSAYNQTNFYDVSPIQLECITDEDLLALPAEAVKRRKDTSPNLFVTARVSYKISVKAYTRRRWAYKWVYDEIVHYRSHDKLVQTANGRKRMSSLYIEEAKTLKTKYPADKCVMMKKQKNERK